MIYCVNSHIKILNVWLISVLPLLKYIIIRGLFLLKHPVYVLV